jgi:hypothetical protein
VSKNGIAHAAPEQVAMGKAFISHLIYGRLEGAAYATYVLKLAWDMTEEGDPKGLMTAAYELGMGRVAAMITKATSCRMAPGETIPPGVDGVHVLKTEHGPVVLLHYAVGNEDSVGEWEIRRRLPRDPPTWFEEST